MTDIITINSAGAVIRDDLSLTSVNNAILYAPEIYYEANPSTNGRGVALGYSTSQNQMGLFSTNVTGYTLPQPLLTFNPSGGAVIIPSLEVTTLSVNNIQSISGLINLGPISGLNAMSVMTESASLGGIVNVNGTNVPLPISSPLNVEQNLTISNNSEFINTELYTSFSGHWQSLNVAPNTALQFVTNLTNINTSARTDLVPSNAIDHLILSASGTGLYSVSYTFSLSGGTLNLGDEIFSQVNSTSGTIAACSNFFFRNGVTFPVVSGWGAGGENVFLSTDLLYLYVWTSQTLTGSPTFTVNWYVRRVQS
jgi:hypothetical protein